MRPHGPTGVTLSMPNADNNVRKASAIGKRILENFGVGCTHMLQKNVDRAEYMKVILLETQNLCG